jgi:ABC-type glycerol-3-phosphate transport system substrate-binding protein
MNNFQTILVAVFLAFFVFAVLIFSGLLKIGGSSGTSNQPQGKVVIWGTFTSPDVSKVFQDVTTTNQDLTISYVKKDEATYSNSLIEAFANGTGPDLFFITPDMIMKDENFIYKIPYANYPEKTYNDSFIDGADVYLSKDGIIGFPVVVDPIVLYYNKNILSNEGISQSPQYWDELFNLNSQLTKVKSGGTITQSMIALGGYDNINNAKDILSTLFIQSGNSIVQRTDTGYNAVLTQNSSSSISPIESAVNFFMNFSNPSNTAYSWNRALPNSRDMFTGGKLGMYIGFASELFNLQSINPNISFDVSEIPQARDTSIKRTYGKIYALAVNKKSANITAAFGVAGMFSSGDPAKNFGIAVSLPPASRSLLATRPTDPYLFTFFNSAVITRSWIEPSEGDSDKIFSEMIQNISSNKLSTSDALNRVQSQLDQVIKK